MLYTMVLVEDWGLVQVQDRRKALYAYRIAVYVSHRTMLQPEWSTRSARTTTMLFLVATAYNENATQQWEFSHTPHYHYNRMRVKVKGSQIRSSVLRNCIHLVLGLLVTNSAGIGR